MRYIWVSTQNSSSLLTCQIKGSNCDQSTVGSNAVHDVIINVVSHTVLVRRARGWDGVGDSDPSRGMELVTVIHLFSDRETTFHFSMLYDDPKGTL